MDNKRLYRLFELYYKGTATDTETTELMNALACVSDEEISAILLTTWNEERGQPPFSTAGLRENLLSKLHPEPDDSPEVVRMGKLNRRWRIVAAAAAVLLLTISASVFFFTRKNQKEVIAVQSRPKQPVIQDVAPGGDKAILTLADGTRIVLDTASNGALAQQGGIKVIKLGGQLSYNAAGNATEVLYNTITTPKGGQYQLELADGSRVWLNAASSLRFPTAFTGKERGVELTGEGYFEVAHHAAMPFHVKVADIDVQVLGTHFNINSYSDEPSVKTTLLKGRVEVSKNDKHIYLNPGQQAVTEPGADNIRVNNDIDVEETVAWKNGHFLFNSVDIETIMRQVSRWYDVDVVFEKRTRETFSGDLPRSQNVSQLLKMLEATGSMNFEINGKQIIVKSK